MIVGRWTAVDGTRQTSASRPYEPMALRQLQTKLVTSDELDRGYEVVGKDGRSRQREYRVVAYVVEDPASGA